MTIIEELHHDFLLIADMKAPIKTKARMLTELLSQYHNVWRVSGITEGALHVFIQNDFIKIPRMGINRSHKIDRVKSYTQMFEKVDTDTNSWWKLFYDNDETVLATSSENMSSKSSNVIHFDNPDFLFRNSGFNWRYGKQERDFLIALSIEKGYTKTSSPIHSD